MRPVQVRRAAHAIGDGYYETEVQAWAGILAAANDDVDAAAQAHRRLVAETHHAGQELAARRVASRKAETAFAAWHAAQAEKRGAAV